MFGLVLQQSRRRPEDEHWWDRDPAVRARNLRFEAKLNSIIDPDDDEPPRRRRDDDVHPLIRFAMRVGWPAALATAVLAWWLTVGEKKIDRMNTVVSDMRGEVRDLVKQMERIERAQTLIADLQRAECYNSARTEQARQNCRQPWNLK